MRPKQFKAKDTRADEPEYESNNPQDRSLKIWELEMPTKESPGDVKENVAKLVVNERGKRPNPMGSEEQVAEGVENRAKIEMINVENTNPPM